MKTPRKVIRVIGPSIAYVSLTQGLFALIESWDAEKVDAQCWFAARATAFKTPVYYARRAASSANARCLLLHRFLMGEPENHVDHKNGNTLDCRRVANLREAGYPENNWNARRRSDNTSGFKGVGWNIVRRKFVARIRKNGVRQCLGYFDSAQDAAKAYQLAAAELHGEFARF